MHGRIDQEIVFKGTSDSFLNIIQEHYNMPPDIDDYTTDYL